MIETRNESWRFKSQAEDRTTRACAVSGKKSFEHVDHMPSHQRAIPEYEAGTVVVRAKTARLMAFPQVKERREIAAVSPS